MEENKLKMMVNVINSLMEKEDNSLALLSNITAVMNEFIDDINWVGFYFLYDNTLKLGPFQGKPACMSIEINEGVCGATIRDAKTYIVKNVHEFDGHIACDSRSNSEICVPLVFNDKLLGLIDIDSESFDRFNEVHQRYLENLASNISKLVYNLLDLN